ncbi:MAG: anti-sigma factor [Alphaproteobacteria bacterium]|nr:anti-sigma factor [Alphaproteobacteria bacterium]
MSGDEEKDMLAAEYVVGTLTSDERQAVAARRLHDTDLDAAIIAWEARLSAWLSDYQSVAPPPHLRAAINNRIARTDSPTPLLIDEPAKLRRSLNRWRTAAVGGYALAASLGAFLVFRQAPVAPSAERFVAVFQSNDEQPVFVMSIDLKSRQIVVRPVTARPTPGKTYQLWIASDRLGDKPRSLGLLDDPSQPTRKTLPYDPDLLQEATFGISVEPEGGSPTGTPTGQAIHGRLIPTKL